MLNSRVELAPTVDRRYSVQNIRSYHSVAAFKPCYSCELSFPLASYRRVLYRLLPRYPLTLIESLWDENLFFRVFVTRLTFWLFLPPRYYLAILVFVCCIRLREVFLLGHRRLLVPCSDLPFLYIAAIALTSL